MLSIDELPESLDITSLARSLFNVDAGDYSSLDSSLVTTSSDHTSGTCSRSRQHAVSNLQQPPAEIDVLIEDED